MGHVKHFLHRLSGEKSGSVSRRYVSLRPISLVTRVEDRKDAEND